MCFLQFVGFYKLAFFGVRECSDIYSNRGEEQRQSLAAFKGLRSLQQFRLLGHIGEPVAVAVAVTLARHAIGDFGSYYVQ